jgi:hypothetical protein
MKFIPFGDWLPDLPETDNPGAITAQNCLPINGAYGPMPGFAATSIGTINGGSYITNAVKYNGSTDYLSSAGLTSIADGKKGSFSGWVQLDGSGQQLLFAIGSGPRFLVLWAQSAFTIQGKNSSNNTILKLQSSASYSNTTIWYNILASWDLSAGTGYLYINDVSDLSSSTLTNDTIEYSDTAVSTFIARANAGDYLNGSLAEIWFDPTSEIDFSSATNRHKFIDTNGYPVNLGSDGSTPTGSQPILYLKSSASTADANAGSGGDFTIGGTPTIAASSPSGATPTQILGAAGALDSSNIPHNYFANASAIAEYTSTQVTDLSKSGGYNATDYWKFAQYGNKVYATDYADAIQVMDVGGTVFADLAATAPKAKHIANVGQFIVLGYTNGGTYNGVTAGAMPNRVWWSAIDGPTSWPDPLTSAATAVQSSAEDLPQQFGAVQHVTNGSDMFIAMQEHALTRFQYVGGDVVFDVVTYDKEHGLYAPNAAIEVGSLVYFLDVGGFFVTDGQSTRPIGYDKVDKTFLADVDTAYLDHIRVTHDAENKVLLWSYVSTSSSKLGSFVVSDKIMAYNYTDDRWTQITGLTMDLVFPGKTLATTFEDFDSLFSNLDLVVPPPDSPYWNGGNPAIAGFQVLETTAGSGVYASYYGTFTGSALAAVIDTKEVNVNPGGRATVTDIKPIVIGGSPTITVQPGTRLLTTDSVTFGTAASRNSWTGKCNSITDAFYHRFRVNISGGFTNATGVEVDAASGGMA